jgi:RNase P/RNase MRP subunit p29
MQENEFSKRLLLALPRHVRLFRNNTGTGWVGKVVKRLSDILVIKDPRPLHAGLCEGSSDYIGWTEKVITSEMVGQKVAVFTAVETKTKRGRVSSEQENFVARIRDAGGIAFVAKELSDLNGKF